MEKSKGVKIYVQVTAHVNIRHNRNNGQYHTVHFAKHQNMLVIINGKERATGTTNSCLPVCDMLWTCIQVINYTKYSISQLYTTLAL